MTKVPCGVTPIRKCESESALEQSSWDDAPALENKLGFGAHERGANLEPPIPRWQTEQHTVRLVEAYACRCRCGRRAEGAASGGALGRLTYLVHLAILLWWLLDKTPRQRATSALVALTEQLLPSATLTLRLPPIRKFVIAFDDLIREGLFGSPAVA
jgi:hypothetical protein